MWIFSHSRASVNVNHIIRDLMLLFLAFAGESQNDPLANKVPSPGNPQFGLMSEVGPVEMHETGLPELVIYIPWAKG